MTILEVLIRLRDDLRLWVTNNLNQKVSISRKINGKPLSEDITLTANDIGAVTNDSVNTIQANLDVVDDKLTEHMDNSDIHITSEDKAKLNGIETEFNEIQAQIDTITDTKADTNHDHDDKYYTESEMDSKLSNKSDKTHNHDTAYDAKGSAEDALDTAKAYTDTVASGKSNTGHTHSIANVTNLQTTLDGYIYLHP